MGLKESRRDEGIFNQRNIQKVYDLLCKSLTYKADENFLYPSIWPDAALFGWKENYSTKVWSKNNSENDTPNSKNIITFLEQNEMADCSLITAITLDYMAPSQYTHIAEIKLSFDQK